jgi:hypothetical protein
MDFVWPFRGAEEKLISRWFFDTVPPNCGLLGSSADGSLPAEQEKVAPAKSAPVRLKKPVDGSLHCVSYAYTSKIDRFAIGAARQRLSHNTS